MRKKRRIAASRGPAGFIYKYFLKPIIKAKPRSLHLKDWLNIIFCTKERTITRYIVLKKFDLPGRYWAAPLKYYTGYGNRVVLPNSEIWVRIDTTMPDKIDVEAFNGRDGKAQIFSLTRNEFSTIKQFLLEKPFKERARKKSSWER